MHDVMNGPGHVVSALRELAALVPRGLGDHGEPPR
jgi:hypothetical protein